MLDSRLSTVILSSMFDDFIHYSLVRKQWLKQTVADGSETYALHFFTWTAEQWILYSVVAYIISGEMETMYNKVPKKDRKKVDLNLLVNLLIDQYSNQKRLVLFSCFQVATKGWGKLSLSLIYIVEMTKDEYNQLKTFYVQKPLP